jgi:hypothetical protein
MHAFIDHDLTASPPSHYSEAACAGMGQLKEKGVDGFADG